MEEQKDNLIEWINNNVMRGEGRVASGDDGLT